MENPYIIETIFYKIELDKPLPFIPYQTYSTVSFLLVWVGMNNVLHVNCN